MYPRRLWRKAVAKRVFLVGIMLVCIYLYAPENKMYRWYMKENLVCNIGDIAIEEEIRNVSLYHRQNQIRINDIRSDRKHQFIEHIRGLRLPGGTGYITVSGEGRLGNKLFQVAALLGVAAHSGLKPFVIQNHMIRETFAICIPPSPGNMKTLLFKETLAGEYDKRIETLSADTNYTLLGYYQSWKYFHNISHIIRMAFKFKYNFVEKASEILYKYKISKRTLVGVHIRRTDMNEKQQMKMRYLGYISAPKEYIFKAVDYFRKKFKDVVFLICTDDKTWVSNNIKSSDIHLVSTDDANVDLAILSQCDHSIITSGSFGWWGAWLAGGETIYFKNFPQRGSYLASLYKQEDYYPPTWIAME